MFIDINTNTKVPFIDGILNKKLKTTNNGDMLIFLENINKLDNNFINNIEKYSFKEIGKYVMYEILKDCNDFLRTRGV